MKLDISHLSIGEQLRIKRLIERKSQTDISAELNISRSYISLYEKGRLSVSNKHKETILSYINA